MSNTRILGGDGAALDLASPHSDGHWISDRVSRIVEIIKDYDDRIDVQWIPPETRGVNDPEFRLVTLDSLGKPYVMFYVQSQAEFDERTLARIFSSDNAKNPLTLSALDAHNAAVKAVQMKEQMERMEEANDFAHHVFKSPKARYRHNGRVYE